MKPTIAVKLKTFISNLSIISHSFCTSLLHPFSVFCLWMDNLYKISVKFVYFVFEMELEWYGTKFSYICCFMMFVYNIESISTQCLKIFTKYNVYRMKIWMVMRNPFLTKLIEANVFCLSQTDQRMGGFI